VRPPNQREPGAWVISAVVFQTHQVADALDVGIDGRCAVEPVDAGSASFHAAKPRALTFGELADGAVETFSQFLSVDPARQVIDDESVFESIGPETIRGDTLGDQGGDLFDHASAETIFEAATDASSHDVGGPQDPEDPSVQVRHGRGLALVAAGRLGDFDGADKSATILGVGFVVQRAQVGQTRDEFLMGAVCETSAQGLVSIHGYELVLGQNRVQVQTGAAAQDGNVVAPLDLWQHVRKAC